MPEDARDTRRYWRFIVVDQPKQHGYTLSSTGSDKYISYHWRHDRVERCSCRKYEKIVCSHGHGNVFSCPFFPFPLSLHCIIYRLFTLQNETLILTITHSPFSSLMNRRVSLPYLFCPLPVIHSSPQPFAFVKNPMDASLIAFFRVLENLPLLYRHLNLPILFFSFSFDVIFCFSFSFSSW